MEFVIITGMSGAGKSQAIKCLEDLGFFCVDNLPPTLIPKFAELCLQSEKRIDRVALVVDVREGEFLGDLSRALEDLKKEGHFVQVIFLDASDEALIRRFSETRRPHPLARSGMVQEGIHGERELLASLKAQADLIIDTSPLTVHELRKVLLNTFLDFQPKAPKTAFSFVSFGYKFGLPYESDLVFDVRVLPNPHFVQGLQPLTGQDPKVADYLLGFPQTRAFLEKLLDFITFVLPFYIQEGKAYLTIAIGCTGGRHRSVFVTEELAKMLRQDGYEVSVRHRDIGKPS
ncbi:MAG: RNase adapter RapZ [candidate division NC10 bacterium]|nr:RNase adapter RapZ [candidate division NC10 bacterium]